MWASGFHPLKRLKEISPTKYRNCLKRRGERRKLLLRKERRRYEIGLMPLSELPVKLYSGVCYSKREITIRNQAKLRGYVLGSVNPELGERHILFYTEQTDRRPKFEANATRDGFEIKAKPGTKVKVGCYFE